MHRDKPTVLYVDDLPMNLKLFEATFRNDYHIILTEFPEEALKILEEQDVQVLVSDQRMPGMTGTELLEIVAEKYPDIRRYLLTAFTDSETVIEAVNVGRIHGFIKKPLKADEIRSSIDNALELYKLRRKNQMIMDELEKVNAELQSVNELKSEIINCISNEISNPLNQMMGTLHLLKSKIEGNELSSVVNTLDQSVFKLEQFSLLAQQISSLKSPGYSLEKQEVSLAQVIQMASIETREELKELGIKLNTESANDTQHVEGDPGLLVSCLVGLIRFAKEHTGINGEIHINSTMKEGKVECQVVDRGSNYSSTLFELLTEQFSTNENSLNLTMGIELAVSQMIMEAHGGHLIFAKTDEDYGSMKMVFPHE